MIRTITLLAALVILSVQVTKISAQPCQRPNVILIICDDMRYDSFTITGGPDFLNTPSINRIANEGARFDNYYCTYSLCVPSRASIVTGLYPHSHGAVDNCNSIKPGITTLAEVLDDEGYNTAMIGKYHVEEKWSSEWDYWLSCKGKIDYKDPSFYYFNTTKTINGNVEQIIYDSVHKYLSEVDTPFFLDIGHLAPHRVCIPLPVYKGVFANEQMPVPPNYNQFTKWYPSFLYDDPAKLYLDEDELISDYEGYFEGILGIEDNTTDIFNILSQRNLLQNTMIIFMSDNGAIFGEHLLKGKGEAYEPSAHLPLFIRYPKWYPPNTVIDGDFFTLNIDIMPTILDACCIDPAPYNMQGTSVQNLISGSVERPAFLYENIKLGSNTCESVAESIKPSIRAIRAQKYKYISYQCDHTTEEFFDLVHDPYETNNLIKDPSKESAINYLRQQLDVLRDYYSDTLSIDTAFRSCYLVKAAPGSTHYTYVDPIEFRLDPNPAADEVNLFTDEIGDDPVTIVLSNLLGEVLSKDVITPVGGMLSKKMDISNLPQGIYFVRVMQQDMADIKTLLKN